VEESDGQELACGNATEATLIPATFRNADASKKIIQMIIECLK
jgi:hypothetical protein